MPTFSADVLPDQSGRNLGGVGQTWNAYIGTATLTGGFTSSSTVTGNQLVSTVTTGTAPLVVASTTQVANLNASKLEGGTWESPNVIGSGTPNSATFSTLVANGSLVINGGSALTTSSQTGSGSLVLASFPTIASPTITSPTVSNGNFSTPSISNPTITGTTGTGSLKTLTLAPVTGQSINIGGALSVNSSAVSVNANVTTPQQMMYYTVPAGALNSVNRAFKLWASGIYTTQSAQTPTVTFTVQVGSTIIASFVSGATTAAQSNLPWSLTLYGTIATGGASGSIVSHGNMNIKLSSTSSYQDSNTNAGSSAIDLTAAQTISVYVTFSTNAATANICGQGQLILEVMN